MQLLKCGWMIRQYQATFTGFSLVGCFMIHTQVSQGPFHRTSAFGDVLKNKNKKNNIKKFLDQINLEKNKCSIFSIKIHVFH